MKFSEILHKLDEGFKFTNKRWNNENVYIVMLTHVYLHKGYRYLLDHLVIIDDNRGYIGDFTPTTENIFQDKWIEVI